MIDFLTHFKSCLNPARAFAKDFEEESTICWLVSVVPNRTSSVFIETSTPTVCLRMLIENPVNKWGKELLAASVVILTRKLYGIPTKRAGSQSTVQIRREAQSHREDNLVNDILSWRKDIWSLMPLLWLRQWFYNTWIYSVGQHTSRSSWRCNCVFINVSNVVKSKLNIRFDKLSANQKSMRVAAVQRCNAA